MTEHLPECRLSDPCDIDIAEHGFCSMQVEEQFFCIHCMRECICERIQQAMNMATFAATRLTDIDSYNEGRREALADAVQIVEELPCKCNEGADYCDGQTDAIAAIMTLAKGDQP